MGGTTWTTRTTCPTTTRTSWTTRTPRTSRTRRYAWYPSSTTSPMPKYLPNQMCPNLPTILLPTEKEEEICYVHQTCPEALPPQILNTESDHSNLNRPNHQRRRLLGRLETKIVDWTIDLMICYSLFCR